MSQTDSLRRTVWRQTVRAKTSHIANYEPLTDANIGATTYRVFSRTFQFIHPLTEENSTARALLRCCHTCHSRLINCVGQREMPINLTREVRLEVHFVTTLSSSSSLARNSTKFTIDSKAIACRRELARALICVTCSERAVFSHSPNDVKESGQVDDPSMLARNVRKHQKKNSYANYSSGENTR